MGLKKRELPITGRSLLFLGLEQINEFVHNTGDFILRGRGHSDRLHRPIHAARPSREGYPEVALLSGCFPLLLREVFHGVLARLSGMVCGRRAGAPRGGHHIICILLVIEDQHQAPIIEADLLGQWVARDFLECQKCFHGIDALRFGAFAYQFPGLSGRDCYNEFVQHSILTKV